MNFVRTARRVAAVLLFTSTIGGAAGCATVSPWERERLADRAMELEPAPMAAEMESHTHDYREGVTGGFAGAGGGCGCN